MVTPGTITLGLEFVATVAFVAVLL